MTTNAAFVTALQGLTVAGVTRHFDEPPVSVNTADLPAAFPLMPAGGLGGLTVSCMEDNKTRRGRYMIVAEPVAQGTQSANYGALAALMDALETALDALAIPAGGTLSNWVEYDIVTGTTTSVAGTEYWSITADITARNV